MSIWVVHKLLNLALHAAYVTHYLSSDMACQKTYIYKRSAMAVRAVIQGARVYFPCEKRSSRERRLLKS